MDSKKICFTCDLNDDPKLISEYKKYHEAVWPQILESIVDSGFRQLGWRLDGRAFCAGKRRRP